MTHARNKRIFEYCDIYCKISNYVIPVTISYYGNEYYRINIQILIRILVLILILYEINDHIIFEKIVIVFF